MSQQINLGKIRYGGIQTRAKLDKAAVEEYAERFVGTDDEPGTVWPPLDVYHDPIEGPEIYWLGDGSHRLAAAAQLEHEEIVVEVHKGGKWQAAEHQIKSNRDHGVRRTSGDKRKAVEVALSHPTWRQWSDNKVAEFCAVGPHLVADVRHQLCARTVEKPASEPAKRVGKDGKARKPRAKKEVPTVVTEAVPAEADEASFDPAELEAAPHPTVDVTALAAPYKKAIKALGEVKREFNAIAEVERTGVHLVDKISRIRHDVDQLLMTISQSEPVMVCTPCDGAGCPSCYHSGFWTRAIRGSRKS